MAILGLGCRKQSPPLSDCTVMVALVIGGIDTDLVTLSLLDTVLVLSPVGLGALPDVIGDCDPTIAIEGE